MPEPSCLSIINLHPLKGSAIIEIGPAIANSIVDIIFDGNGKNVKKNNALIDSEKFVMGKLIARSFDGLRESWKKIIEFNPELVSVETIASTVEISPPEAMGTLVSFECKMDDVEDMMSIYYPHRVIEPIKNKITSQFLASGIEAVNEPLKSATDRITIPVSAIIGTANLPLKAIEDLDIDNILELNKTIDKDIDIYAGGAIIARGEVVVIDDKFGIRITEIGNKNGNNNGK
jgi:flagellar motor switch protein FliM